MMKTLLLTISALLVTAVAAVGQTLTARAPSNVQTGDNFRLVYTLDTHNASNFRVGDIPDGLELVAGPYTSSQRGIQVINGHTTSNSSITYTLVVSAMKPGTYTIPAAVVTVGGNSIASRELKVTVSGTASANNGGAPRMHDEAEQQRARRDAGTPISADDIFIRVTANKYHVSEQEPILLTYKVYTLVDFVPPEPKLPDLGSRAQVIALPQQNSFHVENYNGRNYRCYTWCQYVMYPQMTGSLEVPAVKFDCTVMQLNRHIDPLEAIFNGGSGIVEVKRTLTAPAVTIQVDPLPTRPDGFSGGVGKFSISGQLDNSEVKANEPVTLRVVVSGAGNLMLIKKPVVTFPKDFVTYDVKVTDMTRLTTNGVEGNMVYDYLAVPNNQGTYEIPPVEFTYYDIATSRYTIVKTEPFHLTVTKGDKTMAATDLDARTADDIRPIKEGKMRRESNHAGFFGTTAYWLAIATTVFVFVVLLVLFRHRAVRNADVVGRKSAKANKVATRRLRLADRLMRQDRPNQFYDEVLHALWGYIGDRLDIPVEQLSRENISDRLSARGVDQVTIDTFVSAIDECEYERYAPGDARGNMDKTYTSAMTAITDIESAMKGRRRAKTAGPALVLLLMTLAGLVPQSLGAVTKANADAEYDKGNYQQAIHDYEEISRTTPDAYVYYNLGNAYYRTDNLPRAILCYERALLLAPGDADIRFNLDMARAKTIDKIVPSGEMFFFTWWRQAVNITDADGWGVTAVVAIVLTLVMALLYLFAGSLVLRKVGFIVALVALAVFIMSNVCAFRQQAAAADSRGAIVMAPSVTMKKTPDAAASDTGVIHEGTKVTITDDTMAEWTCVLVADGRSGWILTSQIEKI